MITMGQTAYEAYAKFHFEHNLEVPTWGEIGDDERRAWEAAAAALI